MITLAVHFDVWVNMHVSFACACVCVHSHLCLRCVQHTLQIFHPNVSLEDNSVCLGFSYVCRCITTSLPTCGGPHSSLRQLNMTWCRSCHGVVAGASGVRSITWRSSARSVRALHCSTVRPVTTTRSLSCVVLGGTVVGFAHVGSRVSSRFPGHPTRVCLPFCFCRPQMMLSILSNINERDPLNQPAGV